jgi:glycerol-3-phosphate acyltransferase PlsY
VTSGRTVPAPPTRCERSAPGQPWWCCCSTPARAFIGFSGGRGVATSTGGLLALVPLAALVVAPIVIFILWRWRYVSLGSISGAALAPVIMILLVLLNLGGSALPHVAFALGAGVVVIAAHADNIARLRAGTERRIGQKESIDPAGGGPS